MANPQQYGIIFKRNARSITAHEGSWNKNAIRPRCLAKKR